MAFEQLNDPAYRREHMFEIINELSKVRDIHSLYDSLDSSQIWLKCLLSIMLQVDEKQLKKEFSHLFDKHNLKANDDEYLVKLAQARYGRDQDLPTILKKSPRLTKEENKRQQMGIFLMALEKNKGDIKHFVQTSRIKSIINKFSSKNADTFLNYAGHGQIDKSELVLSFLSWSSAKTPTAKQAKTLMWEELEKIIELRDIKRLREVLNTQKINVNLAKDGVTSLMYASQTGWLEGVKELISQGANLEEKSTEAGATALMLAAIDGHENVVRELLARGANIEKDSKGWTPLTLAANGGHVGVVSELLNHGANIEEDSKGWTALMFAAERGHENVVRELLARGANIEKDSKGWTPLTLAANGGHVGVVSELLNHGAKVKKKSYAGKTPLTLAANAGHAEVVRELLARDAYIETKKKKPWKLTLTDAALIGAARKGHINVVRELLARGANIEAIGDYGRTPLMQATHSGHVEMARELLDRGANMEAKDSYGMTPLMQAINSGHVEVVRELLARGANIETTDRNGWTPLTLATYRGHVAVVRELLSYGANPNTPRYWKTEKPPSFAERVTEDLLLNRAKQQYYFHQKDAFNYAHEKGFHEIEKMIRDSKAGKKPPLFANKIIEQERESSAAPSSPTPTGTRKSYFISGKKQAGSYGLTIPSAPVSSLASHPEATERAFPISSSAPLSSSVNSSEVKNESFLSNEIQELLNRKESHFDENMKAHIRNCQGINHLLKFSEERGDIPTPQPSEARWIDPLSFNPINIPVYLGWDVYDLDSILKYTREKKDGTREIPATGQPFSLTDLKPAPLLVMAINNSVDDYIKNHKSKPSLPKA